MTAPAPRDGQISGAPLAAPLAQVSVRIGGLAAELLYAGAAPALVAGVMQVNVRVPAQVAAGDAVLMELTIDGRTSQGDVVMAVGAN